MVEEVQFGFEELSTREHLFSPQVEDDPWILYHATSSLVERNIDAQGFVGVSSLVAPEHVIHLASLYRRMNWSGIRTDGYAALAGFTHGRINVGPHTWFRESSTRSLVYAQRSWAGGEWTMSFRQAFDDLLAFLRSETVRQEHLNVQVNQCMELVMNGGAPSRVIRVDAARLAEALEPLRTTAGACTQLVEQYQHGVVYAVKIVESDVPNLMDRGGSGILHRGELSRDRIVGKARLYLGDRPAPRKDDYKSLLTWSKGPLAMRLRTTALSVGAIDQRIAVKDLDRPEWLGDDLSLDVAREYGSPLILQMLDSGKIFYNE